MRNIFAAIAILMLASCAESATPAAVGPYPVTKTVLDGNWEVTKIQFYICNDNHCEVTGYPRAVHGCAIRPLGYLSFTAMSGTRVSGTLVAEVFWTSSCKELNEQLGLVTVANYTLYNNSGQLMMSFKSLDYGHKAYDVEVHSEGEGKLVLDFYDRGYVFSVWADYAGEPMECPYLQSPQTHEDYGYCYMDWHCDVPLASCIAKDDCAYVLGEYDRGYGSWNLGNENECLELKVPDRPWMD